MAKYFSAFIILFSACTIENAEINGDPNSQKPFSFDKKEMVLIPSGELNMGGDNEQADPNEYPKHRVKVNTFWMDLTEVTNHDFLDFTTTTGYITVAERAIDWETLKVDLPPNTPRPHDSILQPGSLVFKQTKMPVPMDNPSLWWEWKIGANWQHPTGPNSSIQSIMDHPVVQIAWEDANAYAKWKGKRLPTEAEWEWAARGGKENEIYPWGNENVGSATDKANFWQGVFPFKNSLKDGFLNTAPVKSYPTNGYGLFDMAGNVWEWCSDWYDIQFYENPKSIVSNSRGPSKPFDPNNPYAKQKTIRGGSFLCSDDYCSGYRNSRRMGTSTDTGLNHTGFRCVGDVEK